MAAINPRWPPNFDKLGVFFGRKIGKTAHDFLKNFFLYQSVNQYEEFYRANF
jgi:hypothetical protein